MARHVSTIRWTVSALLLAAALGCGREHELACIEVRPTQERAAADGALYTPSTQSLLRTHSWLEEVEEIRIAKNGSSAASIEFRAPARPAYFEVKNLPLDYLVPRLHYRPATPADDFDALNLMLAEYSRNGLSVPQGADGDTMAHYQTELSDTVPWRLDGDFQFVPNPSYRPLRVGVVNNCLKAGLWELNAVDRAGEIYHSWFEMPEEVYYGLVAEVNRLEPEFVRRALEWREEETELRLERLREEIRVLSTVGIRLQDEEVGFSSQGSRRKIQRDYALIEEAGQWRRPRKLSDFLHHPVAMSHFIEPGIYAGGTEERQRFDFSFLASPRAATVRMVRPKTSFRWYDEKQPELEGQTFIEIDVDLGDGERMLIGNLPLHLLVEQEDFAIHGFGVGILHASDLAERRKFLIEQGPPPSFAYLVRQDGDRLLGLNSHGRGIEQIFIRSHPRSPSPYWEIVITSYERIVDLVKYRVEMPAELHQLQLRHSRQYIPPIFFSYRDDNVN